MFRPPFGWPQIELVGDPAAGADMVFTIVSGTIVQPMSIRFEVATDANAATRTVSLIYQHQAFIVADVPPEVTQTASQTVLYTFAPGLSSQFTASDNRVRTATPHPIWLIPGDTIRTRINNIQVGDQIGGIRIYLNQYAA